MRLYGWTMVDAVAYDKRSIADSIIRGLGSLMDFTGSRSRRFTDEILSRPIEDDIRADWEAVGNDLWRAIVEYETRNGNSSES